MIKIKNVTKKTNIRFGKRVVPLLLIPALLTGCGGSSSDIEVVKAWQADGSVLSDEEGEDTGAVEITSDIKIGMVTDVGGIEDETFNQGAIEGLDAVSEKTGAETQYEVSVTEDDFSGNFQKIIDDGCSLCWGVGFATGEALLEKAGENPDVNFAVIDNSFEETPSNVTGVVFRAEEPSFLTGYIAAASTKTGKIGFVGGVRGVVIDQFEYGFRAGAAYAAMVYSKDVDIEVEYADSYTDADKGKEIALSMYGNGCDIIYHASGGTGTGVIEAAVDTGNYVIGVDRDQSYLAPENVMTSALKNVNVAIERVSDSFVKGGMIGGKTISFGLSEGAVGIPENHDLYRDEIYDAVLVLEDKIRAGEIDPPASEAEYTEFMNSLG